MTLIRSDSRLKNQVNGAISETLRRSVVQVGDFRGIIIDDLAVVLKEITEIVSKGMDVTYNFGREDGVKDMMSVISGRKRDDQISEETTIRS